MFIFKLLSFLIGHVRIMVWGENLEKFVNMAASRGIYLWDIKRLGEDRILVKARLSAVHPLRHIARNNKCRFKFQEREGVPFILARIRRRKSLVIGAVVFMAGMYLLSSFVWFISIEGNKNLTDEQILKAASRAGLKRFVFRAGLEPARVEKAIREDLPEVSWTGVYVKGTRVIINIAEKTYPGVRDEHPAHIVATKSGLVKEVLVLAGNPLVKDGDTVVAGQVLISGVIPPPQLPLEEQKQDGENKNNTVVPDVPPTIVHAKGLVRARVWYEGYGEALLLEEGVRPTGRESNRLCMKIGPKEIILSGPQNIPFMLYRTEKMVKKPPQWRNISIPVEVISEKYLELENFKEQRTRAGARRLAEERALSEVHGEMPRGTRVMVSDVQEVDVKNPENLVRVKVFLETLEDIGVEKAFQP